MESLKTKRYCIEGRFYEVMNTANRWLNLIENHAKNPVGTNRRENSTIKEEYNDELLKALLSFRDNEYFWQSFENNQLTHEFFLAAANKLINCGFEAIENPTYCLVMEYLKRTTHLKHLEEHSSLKCWCHNIYSSFFDPILADISQRLLYNRLETMMPDELPEFFDFCILGLRLADIDDFEILEILECYLDQFHFITTSKHHMSLESMRIIKLMKTAIVILKENVDLEVADFITTHSIFKRLKELIIYAFERRMYEYGGSGQTNGDYCRYYHQDPHAYLEKSTDLFPIMGDFLFLCPIFITADFGSAIFGETYLEAVDFFISIVRNLLKKNFANVSPHLMKDLFKCTDCMLKLPRMENKSSLSTRQHAIADLGADILMASGKFDNHGSFQCIIDIGFLCISSAKVGLKYLLNMHWLHIKHIWKDLFMKSEPRGENYESDLICSLCHRIKPSQIDLLHFFRDSMIEFLSLKFGKKDPIIAPHVTVQNAICKIIEKSSELKRPSSEIKPLVDIYFEIVQKFESSQWFHFNNLIYFYFNILKSRSRDKFYLNEVELWKTSFDYILDEININILMELNTQPIWRQYHFLNTLEGLVWYSKSTMKTEIREQILQLILLIKSRGKSHNDTEIDRIIKMLNEFN